VFLLCSVGNDEGVDVVCIAEDVDRFVDSVSGLVVVTAEVVVMRGGLVVHFAPCFCFL